jgi:threonine dehydrogenase-like Zn-dependent dehydrogenase
MNRVNAIVMPGPGEPLDLQTFTMPDLEMNSALLRVELSEVCGTDVHLQAGRLEGVPYPIIPGHVSIGYIETIRGKMRDVEGKPLQEGSLVTFLDVHRTCNNCWYCLVAKASTRCPSRRVYGITYGIEDGLTGGWADYVYLKPNTHCLPFNSVAAGRRFMRGGCGLPTALHANQLANIRIGSTVLVLGSGPVGIASIVLAKMSGASQVFCIGGPEGRLSTAQAVGASGVLDIEASSVEARGNWILEKTFGRGADITIEATGCSEAVVHGMRWTREGGRVVVTGQYTDSGTVEFNPHRDLNQKQLEIFGCWGSDFSHFYNAVQMMNDSEVSTVWDKIPVKTYPLVRAEDAIRAVEEGTVSKALIDPKSSSG